MTPDAQPDSFEGTTTPPAVTTSTTSYGFADLGPGIGVGYAWNNVLLGVRAQLLSSSSGANNATNISLLPRLEYDFEPGQTGAFLAGILGVEHDSSSNPGISFNGMSTGNSDVSGTDYLFGGAFGVHAFLDPAVSLDPELTVLGASGSTTLSSAGVPDEKASQSGVRVMFTLGLSAWLASKQPAPAADPEGSEAAPAPARAPASDPAEDEPKPLFTNIHLPGHRRLYLQLSQDAAHTSLIIRLTESRTESALAACDDISVFDRSGPFKMRVRRHGDHFVMGQLPLHAVELLANSDAAISVCGAQWLLGAESREQLQTFLSDRRELRDNTAGSDAPEEPAAPTGDTGGGAAEAAPPTPPTAGPG
ncbi:MAG TPA: hypothetical protein VGF76_11920, partial [Polyangiaceae bacterium]